jgi:DNA polymerase (family 10)
MNNKEIARSFNLLAKLMELHNENPYKIRSYQNASSLLSKLGTPLAAMSPEEIQSLKGVGSAISGKIQELLETGMMNTLERYKEKTPLGIQQLVMIKGLGAKKIMTAWKDLGVETAGELLYACEENRLIDLKGFGQKTQEEVRKQLQFFLANQSRFLYPAAEKVATQLAGILKKSLPESRIEFTGALRRREAIIDRLELIVSSRGSLDKILADQPKWSVQSAGDGKWTGIFPPSYPFEIIESTEESFEIDRFLTTGPDHLADKVSNQSALKTETECFDFLNVPGMPPEARDLLTLEKAPDEALVSGEDIKGILHVHSTYSDGVDTLEALATHVKNQGYYYLGITDHSQIAVYANGVSPDRLTQQWNEIDRLNEGMTGFTILKGIECDILSDGSLDYEDDVRALFDFVIASVHTNIKMDENKATSRIIKAIEHPHTNILGHPTGRLLLARDGYPLDMERVIDACAANQVAIELNASPYRLDIDWTWIRKATAEGVAIAVNPDAHAKEAISDIKYGLWAARKGWLTSEQCVNTWSVDQFLRFCQK